MRNIIFRGLYEGCWVYGSYHYSADNKHHYILANEKLLKDGDYMALYDKEVWEVPFESIGQYTGLKDRIGTDIYEGDIVKFHRFTQVLGEDLGVIEGEDESTVIISIYPYGIFYTDIKNEEDAGYLIMVDGIHEESFEVIGNTYQHSELLTTK